MYRERRCKKCRGKEFRMMHASTVTGWHAAPEENATADEHWFCPACDWGSLSEREDVIR